MGNPNRKLDFLSSDSVRRATNERIRNEALRQLDAIDLDDDDATIQPLPAFDFGEPTRSIDEADSGLDLFDAEDAEDAEEQEHSQAN